MANYDDVFKTQPGEKTPQDPRKQRLSPDEWAALRKREREDAYAQADRTMDDISMDGEKFRQFLDVQSRFERYSPTNALLIFANRPDATQLRHKNAWKEKGIHVREGEKAMPILEPGNSYEKADNSTGVYYNVKWVYDISQTDATPEQQPTVHRDPRQLLTALISKRPVPIELVSEQPGGAMFDPDKQTIFVQKGMEADDIFRSVSMALAHAELEMIAPEYSKESADFKAYCASYMLCKQYGIDTKGYEFAKLPDEFTKADTKTRRMDLGEMRDALRSISGRMAKALEQDAPKQQPPRKQER